ncbi:hypothetical protein AAFH68_40500 [Flavobacterium sp. CGRL1]
MNEERYILFDQYLQGELTADAKNDFEKQLLEDPEFASEFETFKEVQFQLANKFGIEQEREAFKQNLTQISEKHFDKKNKSNWFKTMVFSSCSFGCSSIRVILF